MVRRIGGVGTKAHGLVFWDKFILVLDSEGGALLALDHGAAGSEAKALWKVGGRAGGWVHMRLDWVGGTQPRGCVLQPFWLSASSGRRASPDSFAGDGWGRCWRSLLCQRRPPVHRLRPTDSPQAAPPVTCPCSYPPQSPLPPPHPPTCLSRPQLNDARFFLKGLAVVDDIAFFGIAPRAPRGDRADPSVNCHLAAFDLKAEALLWARRLPTHGLLNLVAAPHLAVESTSYSMNTPSLVNYKTRPGARCAALCCAAPGVVLGHAALHLLRSWTGAWHRSVEAGRGMGGYGSWRWRRAVQRRWSGEPWSGRGLHADLFMTHCPLHARLPVV